MEKLYNGICFPAQWPPREEITANSTVMPVPYLQNVPDEIDISVGRQLFVDDFLIEKTDMHRCWHKPVPYAANPVFKPQTALEKGRAGHDAMAAPFSDGVWFDGAAQKYKMWYQAGWFDGTAYAESTDGYHWRRVNADVEPGSNRILPFRQVPEAVDAAEISRNSDGVREVMRDSCAIVLNRDTAQRPFQMFLFVRPGGGELYDSDDGIHWRFVCPTGALGDRSTIFYNPFRKKWVFSIRSSFFGRSRDYCECDSLREGSSLQGSVPWARADRLDIPDADIGLLPTLYNLDAVAYESVMLGAFDIFLGPENQDCSALGLPKITELHLAFSRDGFHWSRSDDRTAFLGASRNPSRWDCGYIHSNNAICTVTEDRLQFFYTAFQGNTAHKNKPVYADGMYDRASMGVATLRRDGFASMNTAENTGFLLTRILRFDGEYLFVNADCRWQGGLKVAVLDENAQAYNGFSAAECVPVTTDGTKLKIAWKNGDSLAALRGKPIRLRFELQRGALYSFWISSKKTGESGGYLAGGMPGKAGLRDE